MRRNGISGIITQKKGSKYWYVVLSYYDEVGKRKHKWISTNIPGPGNKKEATELLRRHLDELNANVGHHIDLDVEIPDLTKSWLMEIKKTVRSNTYEGYYLKAQKIITYYGKHRIRVINFTRQDVKKFMLYLLEHGKKNQKTGKMEPMAANSVRDVIGILRQIFDYAMDVGIVKINPAAGIKIPKTIRQKERIQKDKKEKYLTVEEAKAFVEGIPADEPILGAVIAALELGLRRSEVLGLEWQNVDLGRRQIAISNTITRTTTTHTEDNTKNITSARIIPLSPELTAFFEESQNQKKQNKEFYGVLYTDNDYVFTWPDGRPFRPDYLYKRTKRLLVDAGHPDLTYHSLRHTWVSGLMESGANELMIQRLAGHAPGSEVTKAIYTHLDKQQQIPLTLGILGKKEEKNGT